MSEFANVDVVWAGITDAVSPEERRLLDERTSRAIALFEHDREALEETLEWIWQAMLQRRHSGSGDSDER